MIGDFGHRKANMSDVTLDDLNSLNQEIVAFVKAGIPLELGLRGLSGSVSSRLGRLADRLAGRMAEGRNLSAALAEEGKAVSHIYMAVVEAGLASNKLPEALQSLSESGQLIQETRRRVFLAALYPMICLGVAYLMFCIFITMIAPTIITISDMFPKGWSVQFLELLKQNRDLFTLVVPAITLTLAVVLFLLRHTVAQGLWQWLTTFRWVTGDSLDLAQFSEILALQVDHGVPLQKAFVLAADSTNDRRLRREARLVRNALNDGASLSQALQPVTSLPPLVRWMLSTGEMQRTLGLTLHQMAEMYRRSALRRAAIVRVWLPAAMTVFFTSAIGLAYTLAFFLPLRAFLLGLMDE